MRILVFGSTGMLGHKLMQILGRMHDVTGTVRRETTLYANHPVLKDFELAGPVRAENFTDVVSVIKRNEPDIIINSIGIVKQLAEANDPVKSISINSLFPHQLAQICHETGARLIHYSTDCVFTGLAGNYLETDIPDANDLYGRSKLLGEVSGTNCLTIRTSIIGREVGSTHGLIEWFLSQRGGQVKGYKNAIFSGLTTNAHADLVAKIISDFRDLEGLYHVAAPPISKYDLLQNVKQVYGVDIDIEPDFNEISDRSLNASKFLNKTKIIIPGWSDMIHEMFIDPTPYDLLR